MRATDTVYEKKSELRANLYGSTSLKTMIYPSETNQSLE